MPPRLSTFLALAAVLALARTTTRAAERPSLPLDGTWQFRFDPDGHADFSRNNAAYDRTLTVPGCWDNQGVGAETPKLRHNAVGVGWYRRTFTLPPDWRDKHVWLYVGGAHRTARVYCNEHLLADHAGYPVAFRLDLTPHLRHAGDQSLVIAVDSRPDPVRDALYGCFDLPDFMYVNWGGIFEHVRLEATGETRIDDAFVRTDPARHHADVEIELAGAGGQFTLTYKVTHDTSELAEGTTSIQNAKTTLPLDLPAAPLWTPATPNLLTLDLTLARQNTVLDERQISFGLKRLETKGSHFLLNDSPTFLRGYGDDFNFPRELLPPADASFWTAYLQKRKDFGFNFVRHHSMMPTESYLAAADRVGMLVQPELPIAYMEYFDRAKGDALKLYASVWESYVRQMRNHPSVASWCMGNEQIRPLPFAKEFYDTAKRLDPDRPVIDSDGLGPADDRPTLDYRPVQFDEHVLPWGATRAKYAAPATGKPVVVHEMANFSCLPDPAESARFTGTIKPTWLDEMTAAVKKQGLEDVLPDMLRASWSLQASLIKLNAESARLSPAVAGYEQWLFRDYWTQSTGIESILGATRALTPERSRQFNADAVLLWDHDRVNFRAGESVPVKLVLSDYRRRNSHAPVTRSVPPEGEPARPRAVPPPSSDILPPITLRLGATTVILQHLDARGNSAPIECALHAPGVDQPTKLTLTADAGPDVHNDWPLWIWPPAPKPAPVPTARRLTTDLLARLESGGRLLLTDDTLTFPTLTASFKPAWWKGDEHTDFVHGNLFTNHPALKNFPHDGYGDLQTYSLLDNRPVVNLDDVPGHLRPIIWSLDVPWRLRRLAYLFEARVGKGRLLVSTLDLSRRTRDADPAAAWMYSLLTRYVAGDSFNPTAEIPIDYLRPRADPLPLPDPATCVEGFDHVISSTGERSTWFTDREPAAPLHVIRQTSGTQSLTWQTASVPKDWPHPTVTFVFSGGLGYLSQPDAGPFQLSANGGRPIDIPLTRESAQWPGPDGSTLAFHVLRRTDQDTAGLFALTLPTATLEPGKPVSITITAPGRGSYRWLSLAPYRDTLQSLRGAS